MPFNSRAFVGAFLAFYAAYLLLRRRPRAQRALLLAASYGFYAYWDWRFLSLLLLSTLTDFSLGRALGRLPRTDATALRRRALLGVSLGINLGLLGLFKYLGFFAASAADLLHAFGLHADRITLELVLPLGISFYTFQTLSYTIDVYRGEQEPTDDLLGFALFVAFFPQLVAGPIERAGRLLPQLQGARPIRADQVETGLHLVLWGYFKKVVVADNAGLIADQVFDPAGGAAGLDVLLGTLAFSVQIYGDFSGYTDIARGLARLLGVELGLNFRLPYLAQDPRGFWQRWHISLSTWLRDYLYIPLGGNRGGRANTARNLALTMLLGGLWHGAAWTFVLWGAFHGALLIAYRFTPGAASPPGRVGRVARWASMFLLTQLGWLIFRATSVAQVGALLAAASLRPSADSAGLGFDLLLCALPLVLVQVAQQRSGDLLVLCRLPLAGRALVYGLLVVGLGVFGVRTSPEFIYFQF